MDGDRHDPLPAEPAGWLARLASSGVGRVALSERAMPMIVPVRYRILDGTVTFTVVDAALLAAAESGHIVCFQADAASADGAVLSVSVIGPLELGVATTERVLPNGSARPEPPDCPIARLRTTVTAGRLLQPAG